MKIIFSLIQFFFLCILLVQQPFSQVQNSSPIIQLKVNKSLYLVSEPVWVELDVDLNGFIPDYGPVFIPFDNMDFIFINQRGDTIRYIGGIDGILGHKQFMKYYFLTYNLNDYYGDMDDFKMSQMAWAHKFIPDGYFLQVRINLSKKGEQVYYFSNKVYFIVTEPAGEEKLAREALLDIMSYRINAHFDLNMDWSDVGDTVYNHAIDFERKFKNSVYLDRVRYEVTVGVNENKDFIDSLEQYSLRMIKENPNNYYNQYYLMDIVYKHKEDTTAFLEIFDELKNTYKGTLLEKFINSTLDYMEFAKTIKYE
ncbi:MAG: hypothetical protein ABSF32_10175 [Ignavibacteria bacterium]